MNESTPSRGKALLFQENSKTKMNSINTPILEINKYYEKINKYDGNINFKYKTIAQSRKNNNVSNNESIPKPQNLFLNNYDALNKTTTDSHTDKRDKSDYFRTKSFPKNSTIEMVENKNDNIISKSSSHVPKIKKVIKDSYNQTNENEEENNKNVDNKENNENNKTDEDSENLSKLAEDLLSISDEYNTQLMRKSPIDKNDFIGESKVYYNINNKFNQSNQIENNYSNTNIKNSIIENNNHLPKLQTQLYISPLQKLNLKQSAAYAKKISNNKNISNINNTNFNNFFNNNKMMNKDLNNMNNNIGIEGRKLSINYHISSNSIVNSENNQCNKSTQFTNFNQTSNNDYMSNYDLLNNMNNNDLNLINNSDNYKNNINNNFFNKTALNQYNKNFMDLNVGINNNTNSNINNNININNLNLSVDKKDINSINNFNNISINNNLNSNRNTRNNNHSIGKNMNSMNKGNNSNSKKFTNYSGYNNHNINNNTNTNYSNMDINNKNISNKNLNQKINNIDKKLNKYNTSNINNNNYTKNINAMNTFTGNINNYTSINDKKDMNREYFMKINESKRKAQIDNNLQYTHNRMNNNIIRNKYGNRQNFIAQNSINKSNNYKLNQNIAYEPIKNIRNVNKSVNKNDRFHRKNDININIPVENMLRTSDLQKVQDLNNLSNYNEADGKISMNSVTKKLAYRNSMQSRSQNKKPFNDLKNVINNLNNTPANKNATFLNLKSYLNDNNNMNSNMNYNMNMNNQNDKNQMKTFQQKKIQYSNFNDFQNGYRNKNIYTYQDNKGNNDRINTNFIKNENYMNDSFPKTFFK